MYVCMYIYIYIFLDKTLQHLVSIIYSCKPFKCHNYALIFRPFHKYVWFSVLAFLIITGVIMYIVDWCLVSETSGSTSDGSVSIFESIWIIFAAYLEQGMYHGFDKHDDVTCRLSLSGKIIDYIVSRCFKF